MASLSRGAVLAATRAARFMSAWANHPRRPLFYPVVALGVGLATVPGLAYANGKANGKAVHNDAPAPAKKRVVLVMGGSINPPTFMHLRAFGAVPIEGR